MKIFILSLITVHAFATGPTEGDTISIAKNPGFTVRVVSVKELVKETVGEVSGSIKVIATVEYSNSCNAIDPQFIFPVNYHKGSTGELLLVSHGSSQLGACPTVFDPVHVNYVVYDQVAHVTAATAPKISVNGVAPTIEIVP